jgi:hypothetical protein
MALEPVIQICDTYLVGSSFGKRALSAYGLTERFFSCAYLLAAYFLSVPTAPIIASVGAGSGRGWC